MASLDFDEIPDEPILGLIHDMGCSVLRDSNKCDCDPYVVLSDKAKKKLDKIRR